VTRLYQQIVGTPDLGDYDGAARRRTERLGWHGSRHLWAFAALIGLSLAGIFLIYICTSIARVFFVTTGTLAATSVYGYITQRDLSMFGSFLFMDLTGIIIAGAVNIFI